MRVLGDVSREGVQNVDHSPLVAVVHGCQQFLDHHLAQLQLRLSFQLAADGEGDEGVGDNGCISVVDEVFEQFEKLLFLDEFWGDLVHFGDAECPCLADVGVLILEGLLEGVAEILDDVFDSDAAHGPDGEGSEEGVGLVHGILSGSRCTFRKVFTPRMARSGWVLA